MIAEGRYIKIGVEMENGTASMSVCISSDEGKKMKWKAVMIEDKIRIIGSPSQCNTACLMTFAQRVLEGIDDGFEDYSGMLEEVASSQNEKLSGIVDVH